MAKCARISKLKLAQNLFHDFFFLTLTVRGPCHRKDFKRKKYGDTGLISGKSGSSHQQLFCSRQFLQYIYSMLVAKNHQRIRIRYCVHEFLFIDVFNDINHDYRAAILKKNSLWLLTFFIAVATSCYYEKVRRTMRSAIVS